MGKSNKCERVPSISISSRGVSVSIMTCRKNTVLWRLGRNPGRAFRIVAGALPLLCRSAQSACAPGERRW